MHDPEPPEEAIQVIAQDVLQKAAALRAKSQCGMPAEPRILGGERTIQDVADFSARRAAAEQDKKERAKRKAQDSSAPSGAASPGYMLSSRANACGLLAPRLSTNSARRLETSLGKLW